MMAFNGGLGVHSMWGFSPSMDLLNHHHNPIEAEACITDTNNHDSSGSPPPPPSLSSAPAPAPAAALNILLVQPSDARHIIHTIAHRCRRSKESKDDSSSSHPRQINFYILEGEIEVFARLLLQLHIFLDGNIPMRHRAALFLEIYGNILVQGRTEEYIAHTSSMLRELISGQKYEHEYMKEIVSLDHLKQRDRDDLDSVFKSWSIDVRYDIAMYRDYRLRGYYGDRFDWYGSGDFFIIFLISIMIHACVSKQFQTYYYLQLILLLPILYSRQNLIDWDYFGRVKEVASIIHNKQYQEWRMKGIAFEFGDATYTSPNRTMCTFTKGAVKSGKDCGTLQDFQGFWLDILVGPYIGFGVEINSSDSKRAKQLFDVVNKGSGAEQHRHHTVDVAMYNLLAFMFEIEVRNRREIYNLFFILYCYQEGI
jgi:dynein assembly factor 3